MFRAITVLMFALIGEPCLADGEVPVRASVEVVDDTLAPVPGAIVEISSLLDPESRPIIVGTDYDGQVGLLDLSGGDWIRVWLHETISTRGIALGTYHDVVTPDTTRAGYDAFIQYLTVGQIIAEPVLIQGSATQSQASFLRNAPYNAWQFLTAAGHSVNLPVHVGVLWNKHEVEAFLEYYGYQDDGEDWSRAVVIKTPDVDFGQGGVGLLMNDFGDGFEYQNRHMKTVVLTYAPNAEGDLVVVRMDQMSTREEYLSINGTSPSGYIVLLWYEDSTSLLPLPAGMTAAFQDALRRAGGAGAGGSLITIGETPNCGNCVPPEPPATSGWQCDTGPPPSGISNCPVTAGTKSCNEVISPGSDTRCRTGGTTLEMSITYTGTVTVSVSVSWTIGGNLGGSSGSSGGPSGGVSGSYTRTTTETESVTWEASESETITFEQGTGCGQCVRMWRHSLLCVTPYTKKGPRYRTRTRTQTVWLSPSNFGPGPATTVTVAVVTDDGTCDIDYPDSTSCTEKMTSDTRCDRPTVP